MNQQITALLTQLAHTLGTTIQYLWGVEIRQAYVVGVEDIVWTVILALATYGIYRFLKACVKALRILNSYDSEENTLFDDIPPYVAGLVAGGILMIIVVVCMGFDFTDAISNLINPAHYALQDIASFVKSGGK